MRGPKSVILHKSYNFTNILEKIIIFIKKCVVLLTNNNFYPKSVILHKIYTA